MRMQHSARTKTVQHINPAAYSSTQTPSNGVDCRGWKNLKVILPVGAVGASATMDVKLQESSDDSTYTDITGAAFTQLTNARQNTKRLMEVFLPDRKRYIRAVGTYGGSGSALFGVDFEFSDPIDTDLYATDTYDASV